jgi:outer membrane protein assembly factor BamB
MIQIRAVEQHSHSRIEPPSKSCKEIAMPQSPSMFSVFSSCPRYLFLAISLCCAFFPVAAQNARIAGAGTLPYEDNREGTDVLTRSYDIGRTGANVHEKVLTPAVVAKGLKRLFTLDVMSDPQHPDDPRLEAQPLIVTAIKMSDGKIHDVVYVCTMQNNIWAFDANTGVKIWDAPVSLGHPINPKLTGGPGSTASEIDMWGINIAWGILSTPVIDLERETMYVVNWTSPSGAKADSFYQLHALNLSDGKERPNSPIKIEATYTVGDATVSFQPPNQKQRSALLLLPAENSNLSESGAPVVLSGGGGMATGHGRMPAAPAAKTDRFAPTLIVACGQFGESATGHHGWILAYDSVTLKQTAAFATTPTTGGGGIWQAGQGPAADTAGNIYATASNGGWNGVTDFAETVLMLHYVRPSTTGQGKFELTSWFTPFRDLDRIASEPGTGYPFQDQDLGSAGPVVPRGLGLVFAAGKDGVLYVLQKGKFGNTTRQQIDSSEQFSSLKTPPLFFTYFHGFGVDATNIETLDVNFGVRTHHLHGSPLYWNSPDFGSMLFSWGENESLRAWTTDASGKVVFRAKGHEVASAALAKPGVQGLGGMPGGMLALSANGQTMHSGVVWATAPIDGDGNRFVVSGILRAYDATEFATDPSTSDPLLKLLWDSSLVPFKYNKFCPPVVANGKVYVATYDGRVDVYGPGMP